ncbi:MAG: phage baseplate assembly protein [Deltaproteobacteria bacterium]|nr:phage baseplate assembly protein [Deltaproteobacteria bacterium]
MDRSLLNFLDKYTAPLRRRVMLMVARSIVAAVDDSKKMQLLKIDLLAYRLKSLVEGEVALYTDEGDKSHIKRGGNIEIVAAAKVVVNAPQVDVGDSGLEAVLNGATFQAYFNTHTHVGNAGAPTSPPQVPSDPTHLSVKVKAAK